MNSSLCLQFPETPERFLPFGPHGRECRKGRVCDGHGCARRPAGDLNRCIKLPRERFDDTRAESGLDCLTAAVDLAASVVRDRKGPVGADNLIANDDLTMSFVVGECVLKGIDHELRDDQADADCCLEVALPTSTDIFSEIGRVSPISDAESVSHSLVR